MSCLEKKNVSPTTNAPIYYTLQFPFRFFEQVGHV